MKPQFYLLFFVTFLFSCQKEQIPTVESILDCTFKVDSVFTLSIPCHWEYEQNGNPGDGPSGHLLGNDEKLVYLCGPLAFPNLESVNIPDDAKNLEVVFLEDGRILMYTKVYGESRYLFGYAESFDGERLIRFVVPNLKDHKLLRQILLTLKFE